MDLLHRAIVNMPPPLLREGGVIAAGFDAALDELRSIATGADRHLLELEERERRRTGITQLKVAYNRVHGYYIELPRSQSERAPLDYQRRQTVKNAERYITPELKQFEDKVLGSRDRALARERELFEGLLDRLIAELAPAQAHGRSARDRRRAREPRRARGEPALRAAGTLRRAGPSHRGRAAPGRRARARRSVRAERPRARPTRAACW